MLRAYAPSLAACAESVRRQRKRCLSRFLIAQQLRFLDRHLFFIHFDTCNAADSSAKKSNPGKYDSFESFVNDFI